MTPQRFLRMAGGLMLAGTVSAGWAAPKKGVSLDDLVPTRKPSTGARPAPAPRPQPRKPAPGPATRKPNPAPAIARKPAVAPATQKQGPSLTVGPSAPLKTISEALQKAPAGARILVQSGTYRESLTLTRPVEVLPATLEALVTVEGTGQPTVLLKAGRATLSHLTLKQGPGTSQAAYTVEVSQGELVLDDCAVASGNTACVGVHGKSAAATLRKCRVQGEKAGLEVSAEGRATVEGGSLSNNGGTGAVALGGASLTVRGCRIAENGGAGLLYRDSAQGRVEDCDLTANRELGALVEGGAHPSFKNVRVLRNAHEGIALRDSGTATLEGCDLLENAGAGLYVCRRATVTASSCRFRGNKGNGIDLSERGSGRVEDADVLDNGFFAIVVSGASELVLKRSRVVGIAAKDAVVFLGKGQGLFEACDFSKPPGAAVVAIHEESRPTFRGCKVHGAQCGFWVTGNSQPRLEDCDVYETDDTGVHLQDCSPQMVNCRIFRCGGAGVRCHRAVTATLDGCDLYGNKLANLQVMLGSNAKVTGCAFRDGGAEGIHVNDSSEGTFVKCEVRGNKLAGVGIHQGSNPVFRNCRIIQGKGASGDGVWVADRGRGLFEECAIQGNASSGVTILRGADPVFRRCQITQNGGSGILSLEGGLGTAEASEIVQNRGGNVVLRDTARVALRDCRTE